MLGSVGVLGWEAGSELSGKRGSGFRLNMIITTQFVDYLKMNFLEGIFLSLMGAKRRILEF